MWSSFLNRLFQSSPPNAYSAQRLSGPTNVAPTGTFTTIATLTGVPAGDYAVVAKVDLEAGAAFGADVQLVTDDGTTHANVDHSTVTAAMGVGSAHSEHNLQALVHLANTTSIWLEARGDPPPWSARNAKVLAIRVVSAADAEVTG